MTERTSSRLVDGLASLRLGVGLILGIGLVCAVATFYESRHGTPAVQRAVYQTGWFASLLVLLGVNILFAMVKRRPWTRHHVGFMVAHVGILVLLAGSLVSLHLGVDGTLALYEGEESDRVGLPAQALQVALPGHEVHATFPIDVNRGPARAGREHRFAVPGSAAVLVVEDSLAHAEVVESVEEAAGGTPAVHYILGGSFVRQEGWLLAGDPAHAHFDFGPVSLGLHAAAADGDVAGLLVHAGGGNHLSFVAAPNRSLVYGLVSRKGGDSKGPVEVGRPIETPWMGLTVTVDRFLPSAVMRRSVTPAVPPAKEERRVPALKVRLEGPTARGDGEWVLWTEVREVPFAGGLATIAFRAPEIALPFQVTLLDFQSEKYPGSSMAATYESRVRVTDPAEGVSEHVISMNHPLHHRGYILFQSSFVEGEPMMSVLSVVRAPGLPLVYLGTALISVGLAWMFYVKPWLVRRQAAHALAAHGVQGVPSVGSAVQPVSSQA